jgi:lipoyl synthase
MAPDIAQGRRHPDWIRSRLPAGHTVRELDALLDGLAVNTVCREAICPNLGECWNERTATVMILGDTCTCACGFCAVKTGRPIWFDADEPRRVAAAVARLGLDQIVVTSVTRDDVPDGGADAFAETIRRLRVTCPRMGVKVLIPDFNGEGTRSEPSWLRHRTSSATTSRRWSVSRSRSGGAPATGGHSGSSCGRRP